MSKWIVVSVFVCAGWATACGSDGSGVSGDKTLVSLSDAELTKLCEYTVKQDGPERTIDCGGGLRVTVGGKTVAECVTDLQDNLDQFPSCSATVADAEACAEDFADFTDEELCSSATPLPRSCEPLLSCGGV
jgi:1,6-anhydro-N-acetylmuramate kinase